MQPPESSAAQVSPPSAKDLRPLQFENLAASMPVSQGQRAKQRSHGLQNTLLTFLFIGDALVCYASLVASYVLRFHSPLAQYGPLPRADLSFGLYHPLIITATIFLIGSYAQSKLYSPRFLLRPLKSADAILRATFFSFVVFIAATYFLKFEPSISRFFTTIGFLTTSFVMSTWRFGIGRWILRGRWAELLTQRLVFIGWSKDAARLTDAIAHDRGHSFTVTGVLRPNGRPVEQPSNIPLLGTTQDLDETIAELHVDTVVLVDLDLPRERVVEIASICERRYVEFKIIPSYFQVFISGLQMQTIAGVPILGVEALPLNTALNRFLKRTVDIVGALFGLLFSLPLFLILGALIKIEDRGPVLFRQVRFGRRGKPFMIYKLRSMRTDAEKHTGQCWAVENDPRRLRIGAFMRKWNLDELPQFWNVLRGDMSLVGPRPEMSDLISQHEKIIKNYHPRHVIRPGMTGWAQVNGLRGNTSLSERVRYDLYYIENWTLWLDVQIMLLTFFRRQNAY